MSARVVLLAAAGLVVGVALVVVLVSNLGAALAGRPVAIGRPEDLIQGLQAAPAPTPAPPRLEAESGQELSAYRAEQQQELSSYGWVDRQSGVVRIPIDRAMDLVAQQGLPARQGAMSQDDGAHSPSGASSGRVDERSVP